MMKGTVIEILLVEDNPGDVQLAREALQECKLYNHLYVAKEWEQIHLIEILTLKR